MMLTSKDVSKMLGISSRLVTKYCNSGLFPGAEKKGRDWCFPLSSVTAFVPPKITYQYHSRFKEGDPYIGAAEAARRMGRALDTVKGYCVSGLLPAFQRGRVWMIHPKDIELFVPPKRGGSKPRKVVIK